MENLDLTLKLGLPKSDESVNRYLQDTTLSLRPPMSDDLVMTNIGGQDSKGKSSFDMFSVGPYYEGTRNRMDVNLEFRDYVMKTYSPSAIVAAGTSAGGGAPSASGGGSGEVYRPLAPPDGYVMLDVPVRRAERERAIANALEVDVGGPSGGCGHSRRSDGNRVGNNNEQNKRCTNFNCNTTDTPMWRRGPLGPKTLCNACGIKFRKEEQRKKAREAASNRDINNNNNNNYNNNNNNHNGSNRLFVNDQFYFNYNN